MARPERPLWVDAVEKVGFEEVVVAAAGDHQNTSDSGVASGC
jgi:hypothetical protein